MGFGRICCIIIAMILIKSGVVLLFKPQCRRVTALSVFTVAAIAAFAGRSLK